MKKFRINDEVSIAPSEICAIKEVVDHEARRKNKDKENTGNGFLGRGFDSNSFHNRLVEYCQNCDKIEYYKKKGLRTMIRTSPENSDYKEFYIYDRTAKQCYDEYAECMKANGLEPDISVWY